MKHKTIQITTLLISLLALSGCADSVNFTIDQPTQLVGFWYGLWHGIILPFSWIVSLFYSDVAIYAVYNNGGWYDFGFFLGVSATLRGSSNKSSK